MAITATHPATSGKKADSHETHDERDARCATNRGTSARPSGVGKSSCAEGSQERPPNAEPESLDAELDDPYDNVACTD